MSLRRMLQLGFIRDEAPPEGGGGGGGADLATELATLKARNLELERTANEHKAKADKEAADKEKANGEFGKIIERYEASIATLTTERDGFKSQIEGEAKTKKAEAFKAAIAKKLGIEEVTPRLAGLLVISGEDLSPEKFDDKAVGKVVDKIRELDPDFLPAGQPPKPPRVGGAKPGNAAEYWAQRARVAAGRA